MDDYNREEYTDGLYNDRYEDSDTKYAFADQYEPRPKRKKDDDKPSPVWKVVKLVGSALIFGLIAGCTMLAVNKLGGGTSGKEPVGERIETTVNENTVEAAPTDITKVVDNVMPSVVAITCTVQTNGFYGFGTQESEGAGSGFIIAQSNDKLMIATNNHVVDGASSLAVAFCDGTTVSAKTVGTDSYGDLAVISVETKDVKSETLKTIKVATLGNSDKLSVGETVIAIGNALGYGQSVTTGVISAKNREVSFTDGTLTLLQTDAAINPGNSGGVLINLKGEVIGINNAKLADTEVEGMGYAIPITTAKVTLDDIMNAGSIKEEDMAYLGIIGKTIDKTYSSALGIPSGTYVTNVIKNSPAEKAGISAGDVITGIDGSDISSMESLKGKLNRKKAGTTVTIVYKRANQNGDYEEHTVDVELGRKGDYEEEVEEFSEYFKDDSQDSQNNGNSWFGNGGSDNGGSGSYGYGSNGGQGFSEEDIFNYFFGQR